MKYTILNFLSQIAEEREISEEVVKNLLKESVTIAAKKRFGERVEIETDIDERNGSISTWLVKTIVKNVKDSDTEIALRNARNFKADVKIGERLRIEVPFKHFGRNATLVAKQILFQKVREAEKKVIYENFQQRVGEVITGSVRRIDKKGLTVSIDKAEGILPKKEQIPGERYRQGNTIRVYIASVEPRGIILSRTHPAFLKKLFESEVPEITEGLIEIKQVARIPGIRAKVAVISKDPKIDPIGACVGVKGSRVQSVVKELYGEKIDVVQWNPEPMVFISRALSSVSILKEDINMETRVANIVVSDDELPVAIGKNGQNVYLASKLTGFKINAVPESAYISAGVENLKGLTENLKKKLINTGFKSSYDIIFRGISPLLKVSGVGKKTGEKIFELAYNFLEANKRKPK
jgi:N utilization substance protein A